MLVLISPVILSVLLAGASSASAHVLGNTAAPSFDWNWQPWILASLALAALGYSRGLIRLHRRLERQALVGAGAIAAFYGGLAILFIALVSPLDSIAEELFWVHMIQHLLLLLVAAPLLVLGRPAIVWLWAFGRGGRRQIGHLWAASGLHRAVEVAMHPILVWAVFCGVFIFWHFPGPYQWALRDEGLHTFEHLSFLLTALMFWSIVIEPSGRRRLEYGPTMVFVVTAAILSGLPGALIALAPRPLYTAHAEGAAAWGLTLLQDQQLAGIVMWIPGGFIYLVAVAFVFVRWLQRGEPREARFSKRAALPLLLVCTMPFLLGGCDEDHPQNAAASDQPTRGASLIRSYGCGTCHVVPGIADANGHVGPPLTQIGRRIYIAGLLRNNPDNLVAWLRDPQRIVPGNAMPDMGMSEADARAIAAYLDTLR